MPIIESNIPQELRALPQWVNWVLEKRDGKDTKIPTQPNGNRASSTDRKTWSTFFVVLKNSDKIGFVFTREAGYVGIDLDKCRNAKTGVTENWALNIISELDSYTELSQSGMGWHIIVKGTLPREGRHPQYSQLEMYDDGRYFTFSSVLQNGVGRRTIELRDLSTLHARLLAKEFVFNKPDKVRVIDDESAEDFRLIGELQKSSGTRDANELEDMFRNAHQERYLDRNNSKKSRAGKSYFRYTIERFLAKLDPDADAARKPITETANAERLFDKYGDEIRYASDRGLWCAWDGKSWNTDDVGGLARRIDEVARDIYIESASAKSEFMRKALGKWAVSSESKRVKDNSISLARYIDGIEVREFASVFDTHPMLLNVRNGTVDLRTGKILPHNRDHFITKIVDIKYSEHAECPRFLKFLSDALPDPGMLGYLTRVAGYCLTGMTTEQKWWMFHGVTASGKSTLINVLQGLLGPYAVALPENYFLVTPNASKDYSTAHLVGARLATCVETNEGRRLDVAKLKSLTGDDVISAELKYQNSFNFRPQMKLVLATNNKPHVSAGDEAIWRRLKLVSFTKMIAEEDRIENFAGELLEQEGAGILRWAITGCLAWREDKMRDPESVKIAGEEYRSDEDNTQEFLADYCVMEGEVERKELYSAYDKWAKENHAWRAPNVALGRDLARLGVVIDRGRRRFHGLRLRTVGDPTLV